MDNFYGLKNQFIMTFYDILFLMDKKPKVQYASFLPTSTKSLKFNLKHFLRAPQKVIFHFGSGPSQKTWTLPAKIFNKVQ